MSGQRLNFSRGRFPSFSRVEDALPLEQPVISFLRNSGPRSLTVPHLVSKMIGTRGPSSAGVPQVAERVAVAFSSEGGSVDRRWFATLNYTNSMVRQVSWKPCMPINAKDEVEVFFCFAACGRVPVFEW